MTRGMPLRFAGPSGVTSFLQGALGGGGLADYIAMAADGSKFFLRGNTPNSYLWRSSTQQYSNISVSPNMDTLGIGVNGYGTPYAHAIAPSDSNRMYLIIGVLPNRLGYQAFGADYGQLYRSDDGGASWFCPSRNPVSGAFTNCISCTVNPVGTNPIAVDPNNKDIVYIGGRNGAIQVTYDGGVTISYLTTLLSAALLYSATASGNGGSVGVCGSNTINVVSNPIHGGVGATGSWGVLNITHPFSIGGSYVDDFYVDASSSSTTIVLPGVLLQSQSVGVPSVFGDLSVSNGDTIYLAYGGSVAIDPSFGTIANPGGSGLASKRVYFGWAAGADSIWKTDNAGGTFAKVGTGGPAFAAGRMRVSNDATLGGGGNNVLWIPNVDFYWRYVETKPTGSSLTNSTWTSIAGSTVWSGGGSNLAVIALPDPNTQGRVVFYEDRGLSNVSLDYGGSFIGYTLSPAPTRNAGDTAWLVTDDIALNDAKFDGGVAGKIWLADGVGTWYYTQTDSSAVQSWTANMQTMQSLIVTNVTKTPSPNGKIYLSNQDRPIIRCVDVNTVPDGYFPGTVVNQAAGYTCYSLNDPTKVFAAYSVDIYQDAGTSSGGVQNFTAITTSNTHGWPNGGLGWIDIKSRSSTEIIALSNGANILYGTLSGGIWSWTNSLFGGNPIVGVNGGNAFNKIKALEIDLVSGTVWYVDATAGTTYKSTDGGATFTRPGAAGAGAGFTTAGTGAQLAVVNGQTNHLFFAQGYLAGSANTSKLSFTNDGGATWTSVAATLYIFGVAVGPAAPGATYPTIYITGQLAANPTFSYSVYRCTDFNSATAVGTWVDVGTNLKRVNCDNLAGGLEADPETYGMFYIGTSDAGYVRGALG